jgi:peptidoglycan-N-acetylglucosamine deacetylase
LGVLVACLVATSIAGPILPLVQISAGQRTVSSTLLDPPPAEEEPILNPARQRITEGAAAAAALRYAYFVNWDDNSFSSLKRNSNMLDVLIVEWLHLGDADGRITRSDPGKETLVSSWTKANAPGLKLFPLVNNYNAEEKRWDGEAVALMLASKEARAYFIDEIYRYVVGGGFGGFVLDLEQIPSASQQAYVSLVRELSGVLRAYDAKLLVAVPASDSDYDYVNLAEAADALILMTYDEHFELGAPGPLAGQGWFEEKLDERFGEIARNKLVVSIGSYGYDWAAPGVGREISVQEAWELLEQSGATLLPDPVSLNPTFSYVEEIEKKQHQVWYLDAVTAYNQIGAALAMRPAGLALWRLGTEDAGIWAAFGHGRRADSSALEAVKTLRPGYDLLYKGKGEVLSVAGTLQPGSRRLDIDADHNLITGQTILEYPRSATVSRWGASAEKVIALTFDDGPNRTYTPKILDVLRQKDVKATFFIVGSAGALHSDLLVRIHRDGHDIGNHTFTHMNSAEVSNEHLKLEVNATQRLIEATLGVRTKLFRPPYARDLEPSTIDGAEVLRFVGSLGYFTIGMGIDPKDWYRPNARLIVDKTVEGALKGGGNVVLLHDAGGIRDATVDALPLIIDRLRAEGFRFVTIHELLGLSREAVMPRVEQANSWVIRSNHASFALYSGMNVFVGLLFQIGLALGTLRLVWVASSAIVHARWEKLRADHKWVPQSVAVIVPAFNEEKVICASIRALLASHLRKFKIVVVDDGSSDNTAQVVREAFAGTSRVRVLTKPNGGKWSALNWGLMHASAEIVIILDADTVFEPDAVSLLVRHFADPAVAAVAGSASVGNSVNIITRFQALEYTTNQNLDRRALEIVNGISVVPGAIGAWRRDALLSIGGFQSDTLAEDADATIRLERAGWKVVYEPRAVAHTEAPETTRAFLKQRLRWMFGTLQVAFKHRAAMWSGRPVGVGFFALPNILVFQFIFALLAPVIDFVLLWTIVAALNQYVMSPDEGIPPTLITVCAYWLYFQLLEIATSALAIGLDRKPGMLRLVPLLLLQRFCYRQLLYITAVRVAVAALQGRMLGWNKLVRTGSTLAGSG